MHQAKDLSSYQPCFILEVVHTKEGGQVDPTTVGFGMPGRLLSSDLLIHEIMLLLVRRYIRFNESFQEVSLVNQASFKGTSYGSLTIGSRNCLFSPP